ncbi:hypothetical protein [uncultured Nostoc sp.]|uniref:hypothetical protein n=1 Tax=uncultured Nostoc sp. TaxID=340711 RepID=UPI0035CB57B6
MRERNAITQTHETSSVGCCCSPPARSARRSRWPGAPVRHTVRLQTGGLIDFWRIASIPNDQAGEDELFRYKDCTNEVSRVLSFPLP